MLLGGLWVVLGVFCWFASMVSLCCEFDFAGFTWLCLRGSFDSGGFSFGARWTTCLVLVGVLVVTVWFGFGRVAFWFRVGY